MQAGGNDGVFLAKQNFGGPRRSHRRRLSRPLLSGIILIVVPNLGNKD